MKKQIFLVITMNFLSLFSMGPSLPNTNPPVENSELDLITREMTFTVVSPYENSFASHALSPRTTQELEDAEGSDSDEIGQEYQDAGNPFEFHVMLLMTAQEIEEANRQGAQQRKNQLDLRQYIVEQSNGFKRKRGETPDSAIE